MADTLKHTVKISGRFLFRCVCHILLITSPFLTSFSQPPSGILMRPGWILVQSLSDEFNDSTIDARKWTWAPPWGTYHGQLDNTMACLTHEKTNRRETGGSLKLIVTNEPCQCKTWDGKTLQLPYRSGALYSIDTIRYGYFEIRMKIPPVDNEQTKGFGPNFWLWHLMPYTDQTWSEIDVFEIDASQNRYTCNVHYESPGMDQHWAMRKDDSHDISYLDFQNQWHIFACEWSAEKISFFHNGDFICSTNQYCSEQKYLNLVVDINVPAVNFLYSELGEQVTWPYVYEIDYIRTFQKAEAPKPLSSKKQRHRKKDKG